MTDFLKEIFYSFKDRLRNPIIGSFLISTVLWNWQPLSILIFSKWSMDARVDYVTQCYLSNPLYFLGPLGMTVFYLIALPYILWGLEIVVNKSKVGRKSIARKIQIDDVTHDVFIENKRAQKMELKELNDRNDSMQADLISKSTELEELRHTLFMKQDQLAKLDNDQAAIMKDFNLVKLENEKLMKVIEEVNANGEVSKKEIATLMKKENELDRIKYSLKVMSENPATWKAIFSSNLQDLDNFSNSHPVYKSFQYSNLSEKEKVHIVAILVEFYSKYRTIFRGN